MVLRTWGESKKEEGGGDRELGVEIWLFKRSGPEMRGGGRGGAVEAAFCSRDCM